MCCTGNLNIKLKDEGHVSQISLCCTGEKYRGWSLAEPQGLFLMNVTYTPHDDPAVLCHPDIRHDSAGRPLLGREAEQE